MTYLHSETAIYIVSSGLTGQLFSCRDVRGMVTLGMLMSKLVHRRVQSTTPVGEVS